MKAILSSLLLVSLSAPALAEKTLQDCIDTTDNAQRLQCYDSIFGHSKGAGNTSSSSNNHTNDFGGERLKANTESSKSLEAKVIGDVNNLSKGDKVQLTNGQVWIVTDARTLRHKAKSPAVIISKGFMDSYLLEFPGVNRRIKVKRIK